MKMNKELKEYELEMLREMRSKNSFVADNAYVKLHVFYTSLRKGGLLTLAEFNDKIAARNRVFLKGVQSDD